MNIRVVSLTDSENRLIFSSRFKSLSFCFFDAILGKENRTRFNEIMFQDKYNRTVRDGEIGCTLSHCEIIKELAQSDFDSILILEDDAIPTDDFWDFFNTAIFKNDKPSVFLLGHSKTRKKDLWLQRLKQPLKDIIDIGGFKFGLNDRVTGCGTVAYVINKKAAEIISSYNNPYWLADDWGFFKENNILIYHPVEPLVYEDLNTISTTGNMIRLNHSICNKTLIQIGSVIKSRFLFYFKNYL